MVVTTMYKCKHCGNDENFVIKQKGPHTGLYCEDCGRWICWLKENNKVANTYRLPAKSKYHQITIDEYVASLNKELRDTAEKDDLPWK